jgi:hypothetical protein
MKLNVKSFAITCGLFLGICLFLATWWIILFYGPIERVSFIELVYRGYSISPLGSVIGLIWGLVDGAVLGALFALVYNKLIPEPKESTQL